MPGESPQIFSIGHSNQPVEDFLDLLRQHSIEVLVDIRSYPYSKFATQFDGPELKTAVTRGGLKYLYLGKQLGGRPADPDLYDEQGRVEYGRVAETPLFQEGIARLLKGIESYRVAFMCTEEDPTYCHRHLLVSRVLAERGVEVSHIRGDGQVQSEAALKSQPAEETAQLSLFPGEEYTEWKSIRPVSPRKPPPSSSKP
jgi:uncharacterized protein (DUF488 family)